MSDWWNALPAAQQIFYGVGILATLVLVIQLVLTLVGLGDSGAVDDIDVPDHGDAHPSGLKLLSTRTVVAFAAGFGWTGVVALRRDVGLPVTVLLAVVVGFVLMGLVFSFLRILHDLRESGTLNYRNAIGQVASVYLPIPAHQGGPGQVQVKIQGRLMVVQAFTKHGQKIASQSKVRVVDLLDPKTLLVEPLADS